MPDDLKTIKRLEEEIGRRLERIEHNEVGSINSGYSLDDDNRVVGLSLYRVGLNHLPRAILDLAGLEILTLTDNSISELPGQMSRLEKLKALNLGGNGITELPSQISELTQLCELHLYDNEMTVLPSAILGIESLEFLNIHTNSLTLLPDDIARLKNLKYLYLSDNQIRELPPEIAVLNLELKPDTWGGREEEGIYLKGNPLESPPLEIIRQGREAVLEYFSSVEGGEELLNEVKVILVGDGGAGKTSLVRRVMKESFNEQEPQTHGIRLRDWEVKNRDRDILVHFWDFGGQQIMHSTHQFFLSERSLYVLVIDGRKEEDAEYWLKHIESFGGDSPVLVVLNKTDQNPGFEVNRRFLQEKYKNLKGFHRVSCATDKGIKAFTKALIEAMTEMSILETTWPKSWFNVKKQLKDLKKNFISIDDFAGLCAKQGLTEEGSQDTLVGFLHDLGSIVHFKDADLVDMHVLEPKWVTEGVYRIITSTALAKSEGILEIESLKKILRKRNKEDYDYPTKSHKYIIDLMLKFELCFRIDDDTVLVPALLEIEEPEFDFDYEGALKFMIEYDFLPKSVMNRFIVRMHEDIKRPLRWRTGVVLEDKNLKSLAVIKADEKDKRISIHVDGEHRQDFLSRVRETFRDIEDGYEKLEPTELVPLPDNDEIQIDYKELVGHELAGRREIFIGKLQKEYPVAELLDMIEKMDWRIRMLEKMSKPGEVHMTFAPVMSQTQIASQNQQATQDVDVDVKVDIRIALPDIQGEFDELKDFLAEALPDQKDKLEAIGKEIDSITPDSDQKEINSALNKAARFLKKFGDEDSDLSKAVGGVQRGLEYAKKGARLYNKIAPFIGWPGIPGV